MKLKYANILKIWHHFEVQTSNFAIFQVSKVLREGLILKNGKIWRLDLKMVSNFQNVGIIQLHLKLEIMCDMQELTSS